MTTAAYDIFLYLLRCAVTQQAADIDTLLSKAGGEPIPWSDVYDIADMQTVVGILLPTVQALPPHVQPPRKTILLPWLAAAADIVQANHKLSQAADKLSQRLETDGFHTCMLKGQGVAAYYPDPTLRASGDIDLWIWPADIPYGMKSTLSKRREQIVRFVHQYAPEAKPVYHHIDFPAVQDLSVEIHFTPTWMHSPKLNRQLQQWLTDQAQEQFADGRPTPAFNTVYLLIHLFRHLFQEGVGLRQIIDYYYLLMQPLSDQEKAAARAEIDAIGLSRFAGAVSWVLQQLFDLSADRMLFPPRTAEGEQLLSEMLLAGNFGQADTRFTHYANGTLGAFLTRSRRNLQFVRFYPREALLTMPFKLGQFIWRKYKHYL